MSGQQRLSDLMPRPLTTRSKPWLALATYGSIGVGFATLVTRTCLKHPLFPFQASQSTSPEPFPHRANLPSANPSSANLPQHNLVDVGWYATSAV